jgi:hypothetical protein
MFLISFIVDGSSKAYNVGVIIFDMAFYDYDYCLIGVRQLCLKTILIRL